MAAVRIDEIGVGAGVLDRLRGQELSIVEGVNVARRARDTDRFANLRAERYDHLRVLFEAGRLTILDDRPDRQPEPAQNGQISVEEWALLLTRPHA